MALSYPSSCFAVLLGMIRFNFDMADAVFGEQGSERSATGVSPVAVGHDLHNVWVMPAGNTSNDASNVTACKIPGLVRGAGAVHWNPPTSQPGQTVNHRFRPF